MKILNEILEKTKNLSDKDFITYKEDPDTFKVYSAKYTRKDFNGELSTFYCDILAKDKVTAELIIGLIKERENFIEEIKCVDVLVEVVPVSLEEAKEWKMNLGLDIKENELAFENQFDNYFKAYSLVCNEIKTEPETVNRLLHFFESIEHYTMCIELRDLMN